MPYIKLITGEVLQVAEKTAERVKNNRSSLHVDKATGIRFAGEHVVLIYPDEYDLMPTVERLPDTTENIMDMPRDTFINMSQEKLEETTNSENVNPEKDIMKVNLDGVVIGEVVDKDTSKDKLATFKKPGRPKKK